MEPLTLLPAKPIESVLLSIEKFRLMFTLESFCQCIQDHFYSIGNGHVIWFQSIASIPGWTSQPAQNSWPVQMSWSTREKKPQFHFLTITLEHKVKNWSLRRSVPEHAQQLREGTTDHGAMSHHATHDGNQWTRQDAVLPCARMLAPGCPYESINSQ